MRQPSDTGTTRYITLPSTTTLVDLIRVSGDSTGTAHSGQPVVLQPAPIDGPLLRSLLYFPCCQPIWANLSETWSMFSLPTWSILLVLVLVLWIGLAHVERVFPSIRWHPPCFSMLPLNESFNASNIKIVSIRFFVHQ